MKPFVMTAAAALIAVPAFADTVGEGVVNFSDPNPNVTVSAQMAAANGSPAMDATTLIALEAALDADDYLKLHAMRAEAEVISTQSVSGDVSGQFVDTLAQGDQMALSDAVAAYLDEVAD